MDIGKFFRYKKVFEVLDTINTSLNGLILRREGEGKEGHNNVTMRYGMEMNIILKVL